PPLSPRPLPHGPARRPRPDQGPARPEYQLTPFQARDELTVLEDFCHSVAGGDRTGLVVIHGAGGSGKTRLGLELAERMRRTGWYAGPLREALPSGQSVA